MNRKIGPFIDIVRLEDKEEKLKSFIRAVIDHSAANAVPQEEVVLLIVRSVDSPVAKAVAALVREGIITAPVRTLLAIVPRDDSPTAAETLATLIGTQGGRMVRDVRLFDAHEQLVLGPAASWIGDCMRRDPMKRDAYECFAADCSRTAGWARTSFERLWAICEAVPDDLNHAMPPPVVEDAAIAPVRSTSG
jgi:hypothetical protein